MSEVIVSIPSIGIPAEVLFHPKLTKTEKILFGFLQNLSQTSAGCWASNRYLGKFVDVSPRSVSTAISNLKEYQFIEVEEVNKDPDTNETQRHIFINPDYPKIYRKQNEEVAESLLSNTDRGIVE